MQGELRGKSLIWIECVIDAFLSNNVVGSEVSVVTAFDKDVGGASNLLLGPRLVNHQPFVVVIEIVLTDGYFLLFQVDAEWTSQICWINTRNVARATRLNVDQALELRYLYDSISIVLLLDLLVKELNLIGHWVFLLFKVQSRLAWCKEVFLVGPNNV